MDEVLVAGSRKITTQKYVSDAIHNYPSDISLIIQGGAKGVDTLAKNYAEFNGINCETVRPDYNNIRPEVAPLRRNDQMLEVADGLIAVWDGQSTGTEYVIETALKGPYTKVKEYMLEDYELNSAKVVIAVKDKVKQDVVKQ